MEEINFNAFYDVNQNYCLLMKMTEFSFQIRCVQQMCHKFNSQDFELIFSTVSIINNSGAPQLSKSTHPRKFSNYVTIHRQSDRPSIYTTGTPILFLKLIQRAR